jgi:hypothetical protein
MQTKILSVTNLEVNTDLPQCDLQDNVLSNAVNYLVRMGACASINPAHYAFPTRPLQNDRLYHITFIRKGTSHYYYLNGATYDMLYDGSSWLDLTYPGRPKNGSGRNDFSVCTIGFNVITTFQQYFPMYWSGNVGETNKLLPFDAKRTWKDVNYKCKIIRSHLNFLFALDLTENGIDYPHSYRWSHPADNNGVPFSWNENDRSTLASKESIGGDFGKIIDGLSLRNSFCIYTETSTHILDYTGDEFVFRRRLISASYGLLAANCVVEAAGVHYFLSSNADLIANDGNNLVSLTTNHFRNALKDISKRHYKNSFVKVNPATTEVWFCFPEGTYVFPSKAIVYNYTTKALSIVRLLADVYVRTQERYKRLPSCITDMAFGIDLPPSYPWDSLDTYSVAPPATWDDANFIITDSAQPFTPVGIVNETLPAPVTQSDIWDLDSFSPLANGFYAVGPAVDTVMKVDSDAEYTLATTDMYLQTVYEKLNWALEGQQAAKTLTRIYPHITVVPFTRASGTATLELGYGMRNQDTITWQPPITFNPLTDRKIDVKITGIVLAIRFTFVYWKSLQFYGYDVEYTIDGVR